MLLRCAYVVGVALLLAAAIGGGIWGYPLWQRWQHSAAKVPGADKPAVEKPLSDATTPVKLTSQARQNLGLVSKPLKPTNYWRVLDLPGLVVDRPGVSDRGVVAPVAGTVTKIHAFPGEAVEPNGPLFTIRLISETLHTSQLELYKATGEIEIAQRQKKRLSDLATAGVLPQSRIIEIDNQIERMQGTIDAYRQDLLARGLSAESIAAAAQGKFLTEMIVRAPGTQPPVPQEVVQATHAAEEPDHLPFNFELQTLDVELGKQVEAGAVLCHLADHRMLMIEGHGFRDEMPLVQEAARQGWGVEVDLDSPTTDHWPPFTQKLQIDHLANTVDPTTRTFDFFLPLQNQWQVYTQQNQTRLLWRFRPGTRVRLRVAVEEMPNVFVVPQAAIVREGPEAYVFRQNGDLFDRRPVHVLHEDRLNAVLARDGSLSAGFYVAQSGAASLNRVLKAQAASGAPAGFHVHADGSVHGAH